MIADVPAPEPHRSYYEGPRDSRVGWILLYVVTVVALALIVAAATNGNGWALRAAVALPSFLLGMRLRRWALLGPLVFFVAGFAVLIPLASGDDSGLALAIGGAGILIASAIGVAGVLVGLFVGEWRSLGRDD